MYVFLWPVLQEVVAEGMKALYGLFMQRPSSSSLPADVNAQIINVSHFSHAASLIRQSKLFIMYGSDFNCLLTPVFYPSIIYIYFLNRGNVEEANSLKMYVFVFIFVQGLILWI